MLEKKAKPGTFDGMTLASEIPAWLFEFRYSITHEDDLKTGDAYDIIGRTASMVDLDSDRATARCMNFALSVASLQHQLKSLVDQTIGQLRPMWSCGADIVKSFNDCEIVDDAKPKQYGITFDKKRNKFVMKYNAAENLTIMKRWLNKIGYDDAEATIEKILLFGKEADAVN